MENYNNHIPDIDEDYDDGEDEFGMFLGGLPQIITDPKKDIRSLLKLSE